MMRINPQTGKRFRKGNKREDGWVFHCYLDSKLPDGYYREIWLLPESKRKTKPREIDKLGRQMTKLLGNAKTHSKTKRQIAPEITKQDLIDQWNAQNGKCAYTGWEMSLDTGSKLIASLERRDSSRGYSRDNIVLVCWLANCAKNTLTLDQFIQLCGAVVLHVSNMTDEQRTLTMGAQFT
jgi:hypothetical protein